MAGFRVEWGWITGAPRDETDWVVGERKGDVHATVAGPDARRVLKDIDDPDVVKTLATIAPAPGFAPPAPTVEQRGRYPRARRYVTGCLGMAWPARDRDLNREVALEAIRPEQTGQKGIRRRFLRGSWIT